MLTLLLADILLAVSKGKHQTLLATRTRLLESVHLNCCSEEILFCFLRQGFNV